MPPVPNFQILLLMMTLVLGSMIALMMAFPLLRVIQEIKEK